jgi:hypothetical protein
MRAQPGGVPVRDRTHRLRTLRRTFLGSDAVAWLVGKGHARDAAAAVALGNRLLDAGLLHHAAYEHRLKDSAGLFYRFTADDAALGAALTAEMAAAAAAAPGGGAAAAAFSPRQQAASAGGAAARTPSLSAWKKPQQQQPQQQPTQQQPTQQQRPKSAVDTTNTDTTATANALASALAAENARHPHRLLVTAQLAALRQRVSQLEQAHDEALASALAREDEAVAAARAAAVAGIEQLREEGEAVARELGRAARQASAEVARLRAAVASLRAALAGAGAAILLLAGGLAALAGGGGGRFVGAAAAPLALAAGNSSWLLRLAVPALAAAWAAWSLAVTFARASLDAREQLRLLQEAEAEAVAPAAAAARTKSAGGAALAAAIGSPAATAVAASGDSFGFPGPLPAIRTTTSTVAPSHKPLSRAGSQAGGAPAGAVSAFGAVSAATAAAVAAALETPRQRARRAASLDAPAPGSPAAAIPAAAMPTPFGAAHHQQQAAAASAAAAPTTATGNHQFPLRTVPSASARIQLQGSVNNNANGLSTPKKSLAAPVFQLQPQMTERTAMNTVAAVASAGRAAHYDSTLYAPPTRADFEEGGWRHGPLLVRPHPGVPAMKVLGMTNAPKGSADEREVPAPPLPGDEQARQLALARPPPRRLGVNGVVIHFETDAFVGKAMLNVRGLPSSDDALFAAFKRRSHVVVQGRFKKPLGVSEALTGQEFGRPFEKLPAMWLVEHGLLACARRVSTSSAIGGLTTHPYMLLPLLAAAQIANASRPGEEPDMMSATEDLRLWDPSLVAGSHHEHALSTAGAAPSAADGDAPLPAEARRKLFTRASARASRTFGTDMVWTFHLWQQFIDMSDYTLTVAGAKYDLARHLAGQPLQFLAKTAGGQHLWAFETWNMRLLERAEQAHRENNK